MAEKAERTLTSATSSEPFLARNINRALIATASAVTTTANAINHEPDGSIITPPAAAVAALASGIVLASNLVTLPGFLLVRTANGGTGFGASRLTIQKTPQHIVEGLIN
jgi:hypothetical protein